MPMRTRIKPIMGAPYNNEPIPAKILLVSKSVISVYHVIYSYAL